MWYFLTALVFFHGILHFLGFTNAFGIGAVSQLDSHISKPMGIFWFGVALLFIYTSFLIFIGNGNWWVVAGVALVFSQVLIISTWNEARFGTISNIIIIIPVIINLSTTQFENVFHQDVGSALTHQTPQDNLVTEADLQNLPPPVQLYLRKAGVLNKPKVKNMRVILEGQMRQRGKDYFSFTSEQYNFFDDPGRYFFMKADWFGMTMPGYHRYVRGQASMDIRLFGLYSVVNHTGGVMNTAETVTFFNEMCLLAPSTLIDKRIQWREIDDHTVEAIFQNGELVVKALLYFNDDGQLINFISFDRTDINEMKQYPFSTPVTGYQQLNGQVIFSDGEAIWHYPDEKFTYGKFTLKSIEYNVNKGP